MRLIDADKLRAKVKEFHANNMRRFKETGDSHYSGKCVAADILLYAIDIQPTIFGWRNCDKGRMPIDTDILLSLKEGKVDVGRFDGTQFTIILQPRKVKMSEVTAWQPLPEPWKDGEK